MCSDIVISVKNLSKTYRIFGHPGSRIKEALTFGRISFHRRFTALEDVSFEVKKGEIIGIIGRNGSGKSTLLQIICGILKPTSGAIQVNGRVSALLELGAGFNPEFTGRENVYFQGAVMGLSKADMGERFDGIVAFADIGDFIDQPVRTYSSGMYLRLAFAVAVNVDAEILVIDEALAVGDAGFRSRCFRRIGELRNAGSTILLVSHDMRQIINFCNRALLIDKGELLLSGQPEAVVKQFHWLLDAEPNSQGKRREQIREKQVEGNNDVSGNLEILASGIDGNAYNEAYDPQLCPENTIAYEPNGALIDSVKILATSGLQANLLCSGRVYRCWYRVSFTQDASNVRFAMLINTSAGVDLGGAMSAPLPADGIRSVMKGATADVKFEFSCMLNPGIYHISVAAFGSTAGIEYALHGIKGAGVFRVIPDGSHLGISSVNFSCRPVVQIAGADAL